MWSTMTLSTVPLASWNQMPYTTFGQFKLSWNPAAGPVMVTFWMFIVVAPAALVTIPPLHSGPPASVALIVRLAPSIVIPSGTSSGVVVAQSAVNTQTGAADLSNPHTESIAAADADSAVNHNTPVVANPTTMTPPATSRSYRTNLSPHTQHLPLHPQRRQTVLRGADVTSVLLPAHAKDGRADGCDCEAWSALCSIATAAEIESEIGYYITI